MMKCTIASPITQYYIIIRKCLPQLTLGTVYLNITSNQIIINMIGVEKTEQLDITGKERHTTHLCYYRVHNETKIVKTDISRKDHERFCSVILPSFDEELRGASWLFEF